MGSGRELAPGRELVRELGSGRELVRNFRVGGAE